jgi:hypothetical protein
MGSDFLAVDGFLHSLFLRSLRSFAADKAVGKGFLAAKELKEHKDGVRLLGCLWVSTLPFFYDLCVLLRLKKQLARVF